MQSLSVPHPALVRQHRGGIFHNGLYRIVACSMSPPTNHLLLLDVVLMMDKRYSLDGLQVTASVGLVKAVTLTTPSK